MKDPKIRSEYRQDRRHATHPLFFLGVFVCALTLYAVLECGGQFSEPLQWARYMAYFPVMLMALALSKIYPIGRWVQEVYVDVQRTGGFHLVIRAVTYASLVVIALWPLAKYRETRAKGYYILSLIVIGVVFIGGSILTISAVMMLLWADR